MSPLTPSWIRALGSQDEADTARENAAEQQKHLEGLLLRNGGPKFWASLRRELAIAIEALSEISLDGFSPPTKGFADDHVRVEVRKLGVFPNQTYIDLFYRCGDSVIRCVPMIGDEFRLYLSSNPDGGMGVIPERSEKMLLLDAESAARFILEPMVTTVRSRIHTQH
jgi:hypothetical protein